MSTRTLTVYSTEGLCNRLRVLLSGAVLAQASARAFEMIWNPSASCACLYPDLFETELPAHAAPVSDADAWHDFRRYPPEKIPDLLTDASAHLRVRHFGWLINPQQYSAHHALDAHAQQLWNEMQPIAPIRARITAFQNNAFRPTMIGVHLRRGDFLIAREDVVDNLKSACDAVDAFLERAPDAGILLCTDDGAVMPATGEHASSQGVREVFRQRYGARVISPEATTLDRRDPRAIQDALAELRLLCATQFFVGTQMSTFSEFAVYGRTIPAVMTGGMTTTYQKKLRLYKGTGIYYIVRALGRIEFGANVPYDFAAREYIMRRNWLREKILRRKPTARGH